MIRKVTIVAILSLLYSCGSSGTDSPGDSVYIGDSECLNCGYQKPDDDFVIPEPRERVDLYPEMLAFYYTLDSDYPFEPRYATVTNLTSIEVTITGICIGEADTYFGCSNGNEYFSLVEEYSPFVLQPDESFDIGVVFEWTTCQVKATLNVTTSFPDDPSLSIELYGKVFSI